MTAFLLTNRDESGRIQWRTKEKARSTRVRLALAFGARSPGRQSLGRSGGRVLVVDRHRGHVLGPDHRLLLQLAGAGEVGIGDARGEQTNGPDGVVVARNRVMDQLRV